MLSAHPAVAEAVSFGVPDVKYGEEIHAAVVLRSDVGVEDLRRHAEASLVSFKVPKVIHVASELPKTRDRQGPTPPRRASVLPEIRPRRQPKQRRRAGTWRFWTFTSTSG